MITNYNLCSKKLLGGSQRPHDSARGPVAEPGQGLHDRHHPQGREHAQDQHQDLGPKETQEDQIRLEV
jgi:hypothetical protein